MYGLQVPMEKISILESGLHICEYPGECMLYHRNVWQEINGLLPHYNNIIDVLKFDNSHNRINSKEVSYSVKVIPPPQSETAGLGLVKVVPPQSETTPLKVEATPTQAVCSCLAASSGSIRGGCTLLESQGQCFQTQPPCSSCSIVIFILSFLFMVSDTLWENAHKIDNTNDFMSGI